MSEPPSKVMIGSGDCVRRIALFIAGTLLLALLLNAALSILTLERVYSRSLLSSYTVIGDYHVEKIRRSLTFGKSLDRFSGLDRLLAAMQGENPEITKLAVYSPERELLLSLGAPMTATQDADRWPTAATGTVVVTRSAESYSLTFPIVSAADDSTTGELQGFLVLALPKALVGAKVAAARVQLATTCLLSGILAIGLLLPTIFWLAGRRHGQALRSRILCVTAVVFLGSQVAFSYHAISDFENCYIDDVRQESVKFGELLRVDIDRILDLGVPINKLVRVETLLNDILGNTPELAAITIVDGEQRPLYRLESHATKTVGGGGERAGATPRYQIDLPLAREGKPVGAIHLDIDKAAIDKVRLDLALDLATVALVSLLIGFEFVFFLVALDTAAVLPAAPDTALAPVRTGAFLYAFAMALSLSFLPLYASQLAPLPGLPRELSMALPLSAEMLLVALGLALGGHWLERGDWFASFVCGVLLTGIGVGLCSVAQTSWQLAGCRALVGLGYGLAVMSTQTVLVSLSAAGSRASAITGLEAGYYAGFISSTAIGGMLAEKIGLRAVFVVGALLMLIALAFACLFLRSVGRRQPLPDGAPVVATGATEASLFSLLGDREFLASLLLSAIPSALCLAGFLYFASPLFLSEAGISQSNIARLMMPYGLCMIYLAPLINKWVDTVGDKRIPVLVGGVLGGSALLMFHFIHSPLVFVGILVLFSLSGALSYGARLTLVSESAAARRVGISRTLGIFSSLERVGNILGPLLVGSLLVVFSVTAAIGTIGLVYLACSLLLLLLCRVRRQSPRT